MKKFVVMDGEWAIAHITTDGTLESVQGTFPEYGVWEVGDAPMEVLVALGQMMTFGTMPERRTPYERTR